MKKFLMLQKEGILIGGLWGFISIYASLGLLSSQTSLTWWHKALILPTWLGGMILDSSASTMITIIVPVFIGAAIGAIIDMIYKPKQ